MQLHQVRSPAGSRKRKVIVGRGRGSGHGKRSGKGQTGQNSRAGRGVMSAYEGGQMRLLRRLPKVGFNSKWPTEYQIVNLDSLNCFTDGATVNPEALKNQNLIKTLRRPVKILSEGAISKKLTVVAHRFSKTASEAITKAGGKIQVIGKE
ncbi:MAG: 50S ribosomal protein L15 [Candidatus Omnitrophica bacterium]|nr:50S ribosomal protein L15 [Candidatus Omnitrophota bacterium]